MAKKEPQRKNSEKEYIEELLKDNCVDKDQAAIISAGDGPIRVCAGPGSGKTRSLVYRIVYLLLKYEKEGLKPENIMVLTYTRKAAAELTSRLAYELCRIQKPLNLSDMYIGTIHSQCMSLWNDYSYLLPDEVRTEKNKNLNLPKKEDHSLFFDELIEAAKLLLSYEDEKLREELGNRIKYIIIDESQDNDDQQWELLTLFYRHVTKNIFTVGDPNQSIYMFRNANPEDFLRFPTTDDECDRQRVKEFALKKNYRSDARIVEFCNHFAEESKFFNIEGSLRKDKTICQETSNPYHDEAVIKLKGAAEEAPANVSSIIKSLKESSVIRDYSDAAILTFSPGYLKEHSGSDDDDAQKRFISGLETAGIPVYAPRAQRLAELEEIRQMLGCALMYCGFTDNPYAEAAERIIDKYLPLKRFVNRYIGYTDILIALLSVMPFSGYLMDDEFSDAVLWLAEEFYQYDKIPDNKEGKYYQNDILLSAAGKLQENKWRKKTESQIYELIGCVLLSINKRRKSIGTITRKNVVSGKLLETCDKLASDLIKSKKYTELCAVLNRELYLNYGKNEPIKGLQDEYALYYPKIYQALYRLTEFEPFRDYINPSVLKAKDADEVEPISLCGNIAKFLSEIYQLEHVEGKSIKDILNAFEHNKTKSFEDDEASVMPGHVSVMSIHQSKGLEFPVVFVDYSSLTTGKGDSLDEQKEKRRLLYTAFSRAEKLLVLIKTGDAENTVITDDYLKAQKLVYYDNSSSDTFADMCLANEKTDSFRLPRTYSFTADYAVFERCHLMYRFLKLMDFPSVQRNNVVNGLVAHDVVERINRYRQKGQNTAKITKEQLIEWIESAEKIYSRADNRDTLVHQLMDYLSAVSDSSCTVEYVEKSLAEIRSSVIKAHEEIRYFLKGKVDLVENEADGSYILYDFKTGKHKDESEEHYVKQMCLYTGMLSEEISELRLYYLGQDNPIKAYPIETDETGKGKTRFVMVKDKKLFLEEVMKEMDETVFQIEKLLYSRNSEKSKELSHADFITCVKQNCPFIHHCKRRVL